MKSDTRVIMSRVFNKERERERERERPRDDSILFKVSNFEYLGFFVFFLIFYSKEKGKKKQKSFDTKKRLRV